MKKILIIEDESIVALDIKSALKKFGYVTTDLVSSYDEAIRSVKDNRPDIVFADINLENSKDGIETAIAIKKMYNNMIIIYLTASSDDITMNRAIKTNPQSYLIKPFRREDIKIAISLALEKEKNLIKEFSQEYIKLEYDFYYDLDNSILFYKSQPVKLSAKESHLFKILIENRGKVVEFMELETQIWSESVARDRLKNLVYRVRIKTFSDLISSCDNGYRIE